MKTNKFDVLHCKKRNVPKYKLMKASVGLVSVIAGMSIYFCNNTVTVNAQDVVDESEVIQKSEKVSNSENISETASSLEEKDYAKTESKNNETDQNDILKQSEDANQETNTEKEGTEDTVTESINSSETGNTSTLKQLEPVETENISEEVNTEKEEREDTVTESINSSETGNADTLEQLPSTEKVNVNDTLNKESNSQTGTSESNLSKNTENVNIVDQKSDRIVLSDETPVSQSGTVKFNVNSSGAKIRLLVNDSVVTFEKGIFGHANSTIQFNVGDYVSQGYNHFLSYLGIDYSQVNRYGDVIFKISTSVDGQNWQEVKVTDGITANENSLKVDIELAQDVKFLKLQSDTNGVNYNDHAVFADAILANEDYFNINMPASMQNLDVLDKQIVSKLNNENYTSDEFINLVQENKKLIYQREFVNRVGYDLLERIYRDEKDITSGLNYLFENEKALAYFIETGIGDSGDNYVTVIKNFNDIYQYDKYDIEADEDYLLKLAIATAWAFAKDVTFWAGSDEPQSAVERYEIYKNFTNNSDTLWTDSEIQFFKQQSPAMLKYTVNTRQNNDEIEWFANYIKNVKNGSMNGYHYVEYKGVKSFNDPKYYGAENFDQYDEIYNLSEYNINTENNKKVRWFVVMEVDGVCGAIAKTYTALQETFGRPSGVLNQPGHAASLIYNPDTGWSIVNDISGWANSRDELGQMPLAWGMQSWNSNRSASYILLTQNVLDNYTNYSTATALNILADLYSQSSLLSDAQYIYKIALDIQSNNLDSMYGLINSYNLDSSKTSKDYLDLAYKVVEGFKYYPLPMCDLLNLIEKELDENDLPIFDLLKTNALKDASTATEQDVFQYKVTQTMANALLPTVGNETYSFSFSGDNKNKLIINDKYKNLEFKLAYSLDGGTNWINAEDNEVADLTDVVSLINEKNDILIKIDDFKDIFRIDITKGEIPNSKLVVVNDLENKLIGNIANLEFSIDHGITWNDYDASITFEGAHQVEYRYKAKGTILTSDISTATFNEDNNNPTRRYISIDEIKNVKYANEQNTGSSGMHMIDGNNTTQWHTKWYQITDDKSYTVEFKNEKNLTAIDYLPSGQNGRIADIKIETSLDGVNWEIAVLSQKLDNNTTMKKIDFEARKAKFVRITANSTYGNSASEQNMYVSGLGFDFYESDEVLSSSHEAEEVFKSIMTIKEELYSILKDENLEGLSELYLSNGDLQANLSEKEMLVDKLLKEKLDNLGGEFYIALSLNEEDKKQDLATLLQNNLVISYKVDGKDNFYTLSNNKISSGDETTDNQFDLNLLKMGIKKYLEDLVDPSKPLEILASSQENYLGDTLSESLSKFLSTIINGDYYFYLATDKNYGSLDEVFNKNQLFLDYDGEIDVDKLQQLLS